MAYQEGIFEVEFSALPERLRLVRRLVEAAARLAGCGRESAAEIVIAVNEACMNVIQHAYRGDRAGRMVLKIWTAGGSIVYRLEDFAEPADHSAIRPRNLDDIRPGGLGTHFMAALMDDCRFGHLEGGGGNFLEMRKTIGRG